MATRNNKRNGTKKSAITSGNGMSASLAKVSLSTMPVFPATIKKSLRYADAFSFTATSGAVTNYVLRANDLFDPDLSGGGHQPMGFDQLMTWYNHFCVFESKLTAVFRQTSGTFQPTVCIRVDGSPTPLTVFDRIVEEGGLVIDTLGASGSATDTKELVLKLDIAKLQGVSRKAMTSDSTLRGDAATSPIELTYFHIVVWDSAGVSSTVWVDFILEQTAHFMEPRDLTESTKRDTRSPAYLAAKMEKINQNKPVPSLDEHKTSQLVSAPPRCATASGMKWMFVN